MRTVAANAEGMDFMIPVKNENEELSEVAADAIEVKRGGWKKTITTGLLSKEFGKVLQQARERANMKQSVAAKKIKLNVSRLSEAENGKRLLRDLDIRRLAVIYREDPEVLLYKGGYISAQGITIPVHRIQWAFELLIDDWDFLPRYDIQIESPSDGQEKDGFCQLSDLIDGSDYCTAAYAVLIWGRKTGRRLFSTGETSAVVEWLGCSDAWTGASTLGQALDSECEEIIKRHYAADETGSERFRHVIHIVASREPRDFRMGVSTVDFSDVSAPANDATDPNGAEDFVYRADGIWQEDQ